MRKTHPRSKDRLRTMVNLRNQGLTLQAIADRFSLTRERVRQLLSAAGYVGKPDLAGQHATPERKAFNAQKNRDTVRAWRKAHPEKRAVQFHRYDKKRREQDLDYRLRKSLASDVRTRLRRADADKCALTFDLVGCSLSELRAHLERQFQPGMTWDNWGQFGWHIDHIRPCASFDLTDPSQQKQCFHWSNLQPLWWQDNLAKADKWEAVA